MRLKLETPLFVMDALLEAAKQLLANELATAEEEAEAVSMVRTAQLGIPRKSAGFGCGLGSISFVSQVVNTLHVSCIMV